MPPKNLGISREMALIVAIVAVLCGALGLALILTNNISESSTPAVTSLLGTFGVLLLTLVSALKSTEAADTASKASKDVQQVKREVMNGKADKTDDDGDH